jgi:hypothetical protein
MKTKYLGLLATSIAAVATAGFMSSSREQGLVVHEWGTFTSLQGSDGAPLSWNPLDSSQLPGFVYDWKHAGLDRYPSGMLALGTKSVLVTLQRMETPVIYFYADREQTADVTVRFPKGGITEWFPQAPRIGPSFVPPSGPLARLDSGLHYCGVSPNFTLTSILDGKKVKDSLIQWSNLKILPASRHSDTANRLPSDRSGSHYFAARETDSAYVQATSFSPINSEPECEKFLFYRGVGNFTTPLWVEMKSEDKVTLANSGMRTLSHLFVLAIKDQAGAFVCVDQLKPGERKDALLDLSTQKRPFATLRKQIQKQMAQALTAEGLYPREATAMVKTWEDSWFTEEGVRVLYILPRTWTDETLPMKIEPEPKDLVRVMVGRAELISPETEKKLAFELTQAEKGEAWAEQDLLAKAQSLGRFAGPVFDRALDRTEVQRADRQKLKDKLLYAAAKTPKTR